MENIGCKAEDYEDVITLDGDNTIDRFFKLSSEEKKLVMGLKVHKSMEGRNLKMNCSRGEDLFHRIYEKGPGIYMIHCFSNAKTYVGQSVNVKRRIIRHSSELNTNHHENVYLQRAFNKYGPESFLFMQVEKIDDKSKLIEREYFWDQIYKANEEGFNQSPTNPDPTEEWYFKEGHPTFKLTKEDVAEICEYINNGLTVSEISNYYELSTATVRGIRRGDLWRAVAKDCLDERAKKKYWDQNVLKKLSKDNVSDVCIDINNGLSIEEIMEKYKLGRTTIEYIRGGRVWKEVGERILHSHIMEKYWGTSLKILTEDDAKKICIHLNSGKTANEIAIIMDYSTASIDNVRNGKRWKDVGERFLIQDIKDKHWSKAPQTQLSEIDVVEICKFLNEDATTNEIAEIFNCSESNISFIRKGQIWISVGEKYLNDKIKMKYWNQKPKRQLLEREVVDICKDLSDGLKPVIIAKKHNLSDATISMIRKGKNWRKIGEVYLTNEIKERYWLQI